MAGIINKLHQSRFFGKVFHTLIYCLQKELKDCETVLDLGCGPNSPIKYCKGIKYSVGVEVFKPYLIESKKRKIHTKYLNQKIEEVDFPEKSFDAVILIEVLEHLSEKQGREILKKAEKWAKKKVVVSSPNGFINQKEVDGNKYQKHLSGGSLQRMRDLGYESRGLAGLKFLRQEVQSDTMGDDLLTSIRFRPKFFWFMVATLSQTFSYFLPQVAFELFSVKRKKVLLLSRPFGGFKHVYAGEQSTARSIYSVLNKDFAVDSVKALIVPPHSSVLSLIFYDWIYPFYFSLKNLFNRYSVVVFNAPFQALAIDLFKRGGSKTVVLVHDLFFFDNQLRSWHDKYSYWLFRQVLNRVDFIVANTDEIAQEIKKHFGLNSKVIYLGASSEFDLFSQKDIKSKKVTASLGYIGAYDINRKRVDRILEFLSKANSGLKLKYHFAGPITPKFDDELKKIKATNVSYKIYGLIPEKEKPSFFKNFNFLYFPSRLEGTGLPLIESFKAGVLPIVHQDAKIPQAIKKRCLEVKESSEVVEKVAYYTAHPNQYKDLILKNFKEAGEFDYNNFKDFIKSIF